MSMIMAKSTDAIEAYNLVKTLQKRFVDKLDKSMRYCYC